MTQASASTIDWHAELQRHQRWLRTVILARLGEPAAVEDVFQDVALAAVRQAAPISDAAKVAPWLYRLAVRQVLLFRRRMGRRRKLIDRYVQRMPAESLAVAVPADPLQWLLARERRELVRLALRQLRDGDAEILMLKYCENWSYRDIARHLALSHSAVEARCTERGSGCAAHWAICSRPPSRNSHERR